MASTVYFPAQLQNHDLELQAFLDFNKPTLDETYSQVYSHRTTYFTFGKQEL
ncbi:MAG: hypothetical protein ACBR12_24425 [Microcoleus sp.]|uniref:hypothetical protein n=1 Tax=Microcoleus sp. CAWBG640 TaxID=2841653 RepID=UPI00312B4F9D